MPDPSDELEVALEPETAGAEPATATPPEEAGVRSPAGSGEAASDIEIDVDLLLIEREQFLDAARRAQADLENFRKQVAKRTDDAVQRALGGFVESMLPVFDACDAAVSHGAGEEVEPIVAALFGALSKEGLERLDPKGEPFDPEIAEAVVHEPGAGGEAIVSEVLRTGYRWNGRLLRPAMVKVTD